MRKQQVLDRLAERIEEMRQRFGVKTLAVFGSVVRDEADAASDVDVLVAFKAPADFDRFMDLKFFLEDLLDARVDLVTDKALRPRLRPYIEREAIYVA
jgi:predicted nucleotidyltransferase